MSRGVQSYRFNDIGTKLCRSKKENTRTAKNNRKRSKASAERVLSDDIRSVWKQKALLRRKLIAICEYRGHPIYKKRSNRFLPSVKHGQLFKPK